MEFEKVIRQSKFESGFQKAIINLFYTSNCFRDAHLTIFSKYHIQSQHFNVLRILKGKHPDPVSPGYIKEVMLDKGRDLTRLIDKLQSMGWVHRHICPENKRKMNITLTESGYNTVVTITTKVNEMDERLAILTDEEYHLLSDLLDKMRG